MRRPVPAPAQARATQRSLPAPVRGLVENENLASNGGMGCSVAENVFPLPATVRLRGGHLKVATLGAPVLSLMTWQSGGVQKLLATTATAIYDVSTLNPNVVPTPLLTGQTSGRWSSLQFGTAGGNYLVMVNGTESARYYDGSALRGLFQTSTPIALTGVNSNFLSHVWMHGNRIWAVQKGTRDAWYLPVNEIGGAAVKFPLGSVFKRGGSLLFGETWSGDSGDGMDDRCVFVTDLGEVAVYEGTDPASAETWGLVGRYDFGRPMGPGTVKAGGDLLIAAQDGIVPVSAVVTKDPAALALAAVTLPIEPSWRRAMRKTGILPIQMAKWPREAMLLVGLPADPTTFFTANLQTGAWAKWTGLNAQCFAIYNDLAYFGSSDGNIYGVEQSGEDNGLPYVARISLLPDPLGMPGVHKVARQMQATFRGVVPLTAKLSVAKEYDRSFPPAPNAAPVTSVPALWDVGQWDVAKWDDGDDGDEKPTRKTKWRSVTGGGAALAPQVQVTCSGTRKPDGELVSLDVSFIPGGVVV